MSRNYLIRFCSDLERGSMMRSETRLDFAIFQLTPTRTRCELLVSAGGVTEKLASGLLKPFLSHLKAAEEEIDRGGYSIKLVPFYPDGSTPNGVSWFTKGTMERFVRFVSTPEVLERVSSVEAELVQIEEAISIQANETRVDDQSVRNTPGTPPSGGLMMHTLALDKGAFSTKSRRNSIDAADMIGGESSKWRLLRAMDARRLMLQKEQGMAFARAAAAGFDLEHMEDLIIFADCFGATRLREACVKFMALCKKRQEAGLWLEEMELAAAEAAAIRPEGVIHSAPEFVSGSFTRGKDYADIWSDMQSESGDHRLDEVRDDLSMRSNNSFYVDGRSFNADDEPKRRRASQDDNLADSTGEYVPQGYRSSRRYSQAGGLPSPSIDEHQASAYSHELLGRPYSLSPGKFSASRMAADSVGYGGEHGLCYDYRETEIGRSRGQPGRSVPPTHSPRHVPSFHPISPSSPHGRVPGPAWVQAGEEDQGYDPRSQFVSSYPASGQQFNRHSIHSTVPYNHQSHYVNHPLQQTSYPENISNLHWRQSESYANWAPQPPTSQYWQQQSTSGYSEGPGNDVRCQQFAPVSNGQPHVDTRGSEAVPTNGSSTQAKDSHVVQNLHSDESGNHNLVPGDAQIPQPNLRQQAGECLHDCAQSAKQPEISLNSTPECQQASGSMPKVDASPPRDIVLDRSVSTSQCFHSPLEKEVLSPLDPPSRRVARRITSPRRRSSSPLRKVQLGRSGSRRSGMVVIRNINYIASNSQDRAGSNRDGASEEEYEERMSGGEEDSLQQKGEHVRLSVQDAISLFERKRRDSTDSGGRKVGRQDSRRGSTGSGSSTISDRVKRWSGASEVARDKRAGAQQSKDASLVCDSEDLESKSANLAEQQQNVESSSGEEQEVQSCLKERVGNRGHQCAAKTEFMDESMSDMPYRVGKQNGAVELRSISDFDIEGESGQTVDQPGKHPTPTDGMVLPSRSGGGVVNESRLHSQYFLSEQEEPISHREPPSDDSSMVLECGQRTQGASHERGYRTACQDPSFTSASSLAEEQSKETVLDDSFIVPPRVSTQDHLQPGRRAAMNMEAEIAIDKLDLPKENDQRVSNNGCSYAPEDLLFMPDRNNGRDSFERSWNTAYDMEFYVDGIESKCSDDHDDQKSVVGDSESAKEEKGRFYEQYQEQRDAKLRDESGSKRAEREAKLKAMQEVLERRKEEMASRSGRSAEKLSCSAEAQLRAEKLRIFKAGLLKSKKEKDDEERKRIEELRVLRRERIAARSSPTSGTQSASSTPRATKQAPPTPKPNPLQRLSPSKNLKTPGQPISGRVVSSSPKTTTGKLSGSVIPASNKRAQNVANQGIAADNPLSRSVPSLVDFRKENTKPTIGGSLLNDKLVGGSARIHAKLMGNVNRSKSANDAAPLEANGGVLLRGTGARASVNLDEKKRRSLPARKSIARVTELKVSLHGETSFESVKGVKDTSTEPAGKLLKKSAPMTPSKDAKPFLKKGSGIGPGAGPVVQKLKATLVPESLKSTDDDTLDHSPATPLKAGPTLAGTLEKGTVKNSDTLGHMISVVEEKGALSAVPKEIQDTENAASVPESFSVSLTAFSPTLCIEDSVPPESTLFYTSVTREPLQEREKMLEEETGISEGGGAPEASLVQSEDVHVHIAPLINAPGSPMHSSIIPMVDEVQEYSAPLAPPSPADSFLSLYRQASTPEDYNPPLTLASPSPSQATVGPTADDYDFVLASPSESVILSRIIASENYASSGVTTGSPTGSPATRAFPRLQASLSPDANKVDSSRSRKKWGSSQKSSTANSQHSSKDGPKGFKRLLNFGRKSKPSGTSTLEWVSASTASDGDDDMDDARVGSTSKGGEVSTRKAETSARNSRTSLNGKNDLRYMGDSPEASSRGSDADGSHERGTAPRSFFSLSSFRSKGSTYRA